jgi:chromosome segregation ATPase
MANARSTRLRMAEIYALDLEADTEQQLKQLRQLREDLALNVLTGQGALSAAQERLQVASAATDRLLRQMAAHRELLNELRRTLAVLRKTVSDAADKDVGLHLRLPEN